MLIPGTGVIFTISVGLFQGYRASCYAALGCTFGIIPSLLASIFGLAVVIYTSAIAFQIIKFLGVAYLLYLAWSMWKETGSLILDEKEEKNNLLDVASKAFLINILNPKLTLFFLAFLPQFIPQHAEAPLNNMLLLGGVFMVMTLCVFILYGLLANSIRGYIINSLVAMKYIQRTFAASFAMLGAKLAMTER
ncbi:LysE family translocator [Aliikangiella sp. IMCC44359]|uniref:LysE family translocator n=1 Tax=Aliikangiella sp. IMCC44359 TaxID=3459125 RepID=UPI00403A8441